MMLKEKIKIIIQDSGLSLYEFAQRVGISKNTLINYRNGKTSPSTEFIIKMCKEFSVNPVSLILDKGPLYLTEPEKSVPEIISDIIGDKSPNINKKEAVALLVFEAMKKTHIILTSQGMDKLSKLISDEVWEGMEEACADTLKALVNVIPRWKLQYSDDTIDLFPLFDDEKDQS